jgi:hypothetical protein
MPRMARTGIFARSLFALFAACSTLLAFEVSLDPRTLTEAITIGQSRIDDVRSRIHAPYHIVVGRPPVDYIEIVTPFRRVALDAEAHAHAGTRLYGQREALAALGSDPARVDVVIELTFHPLNTFVGVPDYGVSLQPTSRALVVEPLTVTRIPRFGPRVAGTPLPYPYMVGPPAPNGSQPLLGGSLIASFDGRVLEPVGVYDVAISDKGTQPAKEVARARVDFGRLR